MRAMDWRTSCSRSRNDSNANDGRSPVYTSISSLAASSRKVIIPQSVWWMSMISRVPKKRWEIISERIASSLTTPPCIANNVGIPFLETQHPVHIDARVHAGYNRQQERRCCMERFALAEVLRVPSIVR